MPRDMDHMSEREPAGDAAADDPVTDPTGDFTGDFAGDFTGGPAGDLAGASSWSNPAQADATTTSGRGPADTGDDGLVIGQWRRAGAPLTLAEEHECVERARAGDADAIGRLYDCYVASLYRFCAARTGNETDAEDLTEEIFLKVMRSIGTFHWRALPEREDGSAGASPFRAWLFRIARNHVVSHYRRAAVRQTSGEVPDWMPDAQRGPEEMAELRLTVEEVFRAVEQLSEAQRDVIRLRFGAGLSVQETADALGKQTSNVKVLQHKGVKRLKEILLGAEAVLQDTD